MENKDKVSLIGYASGIAAGDQGCGDAANALKKSNLANALLTAGWQAQWLDILSPVKNKPLLTAVADICTRLAMHTKQLVTANKFFAVLGGDHASAIGNWSGVAVALRKKGALGLIWIDAHMDAHTFETTESGNIHGMPVACLLGFGAKELIHIADNLPKVLPEHLCLIGVRSYEAGEAALLKRLDVRIYYIDEVQQRGIEAVLQEALAIVKKGTSAFGISVDRDSIDPADAPGVGSPAANGIAGHDLCLALKAVSADPKLIGVEITEFNPHRDKNKKTEKLILQLLKSLLPERTADE